MLRNQDEPSCRLDGAGIVTSRSRRGRLASWIARGERQGRHLAGLPSVVLLVAAATGCGAASAGSFALMLPTLTDSVNALVRTSCVSVFIIRILRV